MITNSDFYQSNVQIAIQAQPRDLENFRKCNPQLWKLNMKFTSLTLKLKLSKKLIQISLVAKRSTL